jgi:signal transduction histidine kinase/HAMP domain-containing protein
MSFNLPEHSSLTILTKDGKFVYHSRKEWINKSAFDIAKSDSWSISEKDLKSVIEKDSGILRIPTWITSEREWLFIQPIKAANWKFLLSIPESKALKSVTSLHTRTYYSILLTAILILFSSILISTIILRPLATLNNAISKVSTGEFELLTEVRGNDEIGILSKSLNAMSKELRSHEIGLRKTEEKLKETIKKLNGALAFNEKIINESPIGVGITDAKGNCIMANDMLAEFVGGTKEQLLAQNYHNLDSWKKSGLYEKAILATKNNSREHLEVSFQSTYNKNVSFECYVRPFTTNNENGLILWFINTQERKAIEMERERLIQEVNAYNDDLKKLLYVAAHDLRAPLVNISGFSQELILEISSILDTLDYKNFSKDQQKRIRSLKEHIFPESEKVIQKSTEVIDGYLEGILILSRVVNASTEKKQIEVNSLLSKIVEIFQPKIKKLQASVKVATLPNCYGTEDLLKTIFTNLISNSLKYLSKGRVCEVEVSSTENDNNIIYIVKDNGVGFDKETGKKMFDYFYRSESAHLIEGSGLGLSIAKWAVLKMGGNITFESEIGVGSSFFISVPKKDTQQIT